MSFNYKSLLPTPAQIKAEFPEVITCVGGAPLNNEFAQKIGADYYTDEPQALVEILDKLVA